MNLDFVEQRVRVAWELHPLTKPATLKTADSDVSVLKAIKRQFTQRELSMFGPSLALSGSLVIAIPKWELGGVVPAPGNVIVMEGANWQVHSVPAMVGDIYYRCVVTVIA